MMILLTVENSGALDGPGERVRPRAIYAGREVPVPAFAAEALRILLPVVPILTVGNSRCLDLP